MEAGTKAASLTLPPPGGAAGKKQHLSSPPPFTAVMLFCYNEACPESSYSSCRVSENEDKTKMILLSVQIFFLWENEWERTRQNDGREVYSHFHHQGHPRRHKDRYGGEV